MQLDKSEIQKVVALELGYESELIQEALYQNSFTSSGSST